jgi:hypothetical protein
MAANICHNFHARKRFGFSEPSGFVDRNAAHEEICGNAPVRPDRKNALPSASQQSERGYRHRPGGAREA